MSEEHNHNGTYTRTETCTGRRQIVDLRFARDEMDIASNKFDIKGINKKIDATLIFAIITLVGVVLLFIR